MRLSCSMDAAMLGSRAHEGRPFSKSRFVNEATYSRDTIAKQEYCRFAFKKNNRQPRLLSCTPKTQHTKLLDRQVTSTLDSEVESSDLPPRRLIDRVDLGRR